MSVEGDRPSRDCLAVECYIRLADERQLDWQLRIYDWQKISRFVKNNSIGSRMISRFLKRNLEEG